MSKELCNSGVEVAEDKLYRPEFKVKVYWQLCGFFLSSNNVAKVVDMT